MCHRSTLSQCSQNSSLTRQVLLQPILQSRTEAQKGEWWAVQVMRDTVRLWRLVFLLLPLLPGGQSQGPVPSHTSDAMASSCYPRGREPPAAEGRPWRLQEWVQHLQASIRVRVSNVISSYKGEHVVIVVTIIINNHPNELQSPPLHRVCMCLTRSVGPEEKKLPTHANLHGLMSPLPRGPAVRPRPRLSFKIMG